MSELQRSHGAQGGGDRDEGEVSLSPRQAECLFWVQEGKSSRDIGIILGVSHRIVERHVFRACHKLGVKTRLQAVIRARSLGIISDPPRPARSSRYA
jgi:DNA-binding CsgD family transcriptional regulator